MATLKATNKQLMTVLGAVPLFEDLSQKQLKKVADLRRVARFMAGATLVKQGEIGDSFYVVLTGQAKVVANKRTMNHLLPGDHFGEISSLERRAPLGFGHRRNRDDARDHHAEGFPGLAGQVNPKYLRSVR